MKILLVDGHNLIPKIPGLRLDDLDDEKKLIRILLEYCSFSHTQMELFFDNAPPGHTQTMKHGMIHIHPVRRGLSADDAIISFVRKSGKNARNIGVVSSDHRVQIEVKNLHANVISSDQFSIQVQKILSSDQVIEKQRGKPLSETEIEEWEELFRSDRMN